MPYSNNKEELENKLKNWYYRITLLQLRSDEKTQVVTIRFLCRRISNTLAKRQSFPEEGQERERPRSKTQDYLSWSCRLQQRTVVRSPTNRYSRTNPTSQELF
ncbi:MAG: hypothetical protein H6765_01425 [Candidatus Peribacteria bacterium]|nr:MAG: hypothetical protein H6765_01425 [Candidatus Peribacteria bacterium]